MAHTDRQTQTRRYPRYTKRQINTDTDVQTPTGTQTLTLRRRMRRRMKRRIHICRHPDTHVHTEPEIDRQR